MADAMHDLDVGAGFEAETERSDAGLDDVRTADQDGIGDAFIDDDLRGAKHALVLALGENDPLLLRLAASTTGFMLGPEW